MDNLVARFASNIFWIGRYVERAENVARILDINETYARENEEGPDWRRVLDLHADTDIFLDRYDRVDAANVVAFYVTDRDNASSIASAIYQARENARSVRHLISTEMWTHLNISHNRMLELTARDLRLDNLSRLCAEIKEACQTFEGIAEGTFLRGERWCFYQMGKYLERADQTTRILDMSFERSTEDLGEAMAAVHWNVLLRSVAGYHAFRGRHPAGSQPRDIAMFLLYDHEFPRAVSLCVERLSTRLLELETLHGNRRHESVEHARRALVFALDTGPGSRITQRRLNIFLDELQVYLADVSDAVAATYFSGL
ncbi:MAG: alpha-E domain-containing protein [Alphaproteobacteria bacterium]|nr:alpha-E domain-containing protein [Alphaproteobacteria bacterium]